VRATSPIGTPTPYLDHVLAAALISDGEYTNRFQEVRREIFMDGKVSPLGTGERKGRFLQLDSV
jgi:hypothetical protein